MVTPEAIAAHADDLRTLSLFDELAGTEGWLERARDQIRLDTPEGHIADIIHTALYELKQRLEPIIERLALREAEAEARREAESAEYDRQYAELEAQAGA
jgi:hypothetical protein